jgi:hypothetical protein
MTDLEKLGKELGELVEAKRQAYGNSFASCGDFLKIIFPDGVTPDQYTDLLLLSRIFDKLMRVGNNKDFNNESPYLDIAGYGLLGVDKDKRIKDEASKK